MAASAERDWKGWEGEYVSFKFYVPSIVQMCHSEQMFYNLKHPLKICKIKEI